jgi:predicted SAM-dependent methyltransferase
MLDWCRRNFDSERFEFHRSSDLSKVYNVTGNDSAAYSLPIADGSIDFVFSTSLFTHLLEPELANYCKESFRVLKPGGAMAMYCFSMDHLPPTFGDRFTFGFKIGNSYVESKAAPEAAVAYEESLLFKVAHEAGFARAGCCWEIRSPCCFAANKLGPCAGLVKAGLVRGGGQSL